MLNFLSLNMCLMDVGKTGYRSEEVTNNGLVAQVSTDYKTRPSNNQSQRVWTETTQTKTWWQSRKPRSTCPRTSDAYTTVDIPRSLPIHGMALTSTGRKIEHNKAVFDTQTSESISSISLEKSGFSHLRCVGVLL